ncbi:cytochrome P450 [Frankia sp. EAN1pec]|uniref:cytochrome P450 n=1 Tax=Parafrankia sp. (strain EAN1pec) TaxID=298653 RepID=UPI0002FEBD68
MDDDVDYVDGQITDFHARLAALRAEKGVARLRFGPDTGLMLLRHADVVVALRDETRFSKSGAFRPITFPFLGPNITGYDGHEHNVKRALVSPTFRRTMIPRYIQPVIRPIAEELVADLATLGEADLMATFAKKYPMRITSRLLGIPSDEEDKLASWAFSMLHIAGDPDGAMKANAEFTEYVGPLIDTRRAHPRDDLLSALLTEEVEGQHLDHDEVLGFLRLLFPAGVDTTWQALGSLVHAVLEHPEVHQRLRRDEEERAWAVEETLRWESPVAADSRLTLQDVVVSGVEIAAGELVRLGLSVANRDPDVFPDPDRWNLDRRPTNHITFGLGRHFCLGAHLARVELQVALDVLLQRLPNLRLLEQPQITGIGIRGPKTLRVAWDAPSTPGAP